MGAVTGCSGANCCRPVSSDAVQPPAIAIRGAVKRYGEITAVDGLDLEVPVGVCFGLLGPNGAGKTTTVRTLGTLIAPTSGRRRSPGFS